MDSQTDLVELETQFIIRFPPDIAKQVKHDVQNVSNEEPIFSLELDSEQLHGKVIYNNQRLHAKLFKLPAIVESSKTLDKKNILKTADISQILICQSDSTATNPHHTTDAIPKQHVLHHGLTPPTKNFKKRIRKAKKAAPIISQDIEREVIMLLRADCEAVRLNWELISQSETIPTTDVPMQPVSSALKDIFGECSLSSSDDHSDIQEGNTKYDLDNGLNDSDVPDNDTDKTVNQSSKFQIERELHKLINVSERKLNSIVAISNVTLKGRLQDSLEEVYEKINFLNNAV